MKNTGYKMKDIVITSKRIKTEITAFIVCFVLAVIVNIISIISYGTNWAELFTQLYVVIILAIVFYVVAGVFRLAWMALKKISARK